MAMANPINDSLPHEVPPTTLPDAFLQTVLSSNMVELDYIHAFLRRAMLQVSRRRNTFVIAACLPYDVLFLIFNHTVGMKDSTTLRVLSQVCGRWRAIILEDSLLWRKALNLTGGRKWVGEVMLRTKKVPLWISVDRYDFTEDYSENIVPNVSIVIGNNFSRCAIFDIEGHSGKVEEILDSVNMDCGAPLLHSLSIRNISCPVRDHIMDIPDRLFRIPMPRLTSLCLERCAFSWDAIHTGIASHSRSLTSLCISNVHDDTLATTPLQLSLILQSFPLLKDLWLRDAIVVTASDHEIVAVTLQSLSSLHIQSSIDACAVFLAAICVPSLVNLVVDVNAAPEPSPGDIHELMTSIQLAAPPCLAYTSVNITHHPGCFIIQLGHARAPKPLIEVTLRNSSRQVLGDRFLEIITSMVVIQPLRHVQELRVSVPYSVEGQVEGQVMTETWRHFFHHINMISHIHLGTQPPALLLHTLYQDAYMAAHLQHSDELRLLLPSLAQVSLPPIYEYRIFVDMILDLRASLGGLLTAEALLQQCADIESFSDLDVVRNQIMAWAVNPGHNIPDWVENDVEDESSIDDTID
ncbi:hypothetical protein PISMIDRAFT_17433 [Pisolithus microcarpus 441]|uniref:F-box domain-containing protein n=1 Tax=Pisolithus microcarpus 441 TaxID=765257 RepID=A0A0C9YK79_9AGAM|nr:hypothetical protein PISMIDRAFT_17433 [Pisolithus microcarpus 441]